MNRFWLASFSLSMIAFGGTTLDRRATMVGGGGGGGKCTIEVDVDGAAEVSVSGDAGRLTTLSGQTAVWRRFECTGPLPRNMGDFRFTGVDGRGSQTLSRDPRQNRGTAVVQISDPKGGREGYTFDLEWRDGGGGGWAPPAGPPPGGPSPVARAIKACQDGVVDRLAQDGYRYLNFERTVQDNNPGRNDWITGTASGKRGSRMTRFSFSCSVDFSSGKVRSVDVQKQ
jgi:hypothetical protein